MNDSGPATATTVDPWRAAHRQVRAALVALEEPGADVQRAGEDLRVAWADLLQATGGNVAGQPVPDASSDAEATALPDFARRWLRAHYGDDAHVEGACLAWLFPEPETEVTAPLPAELRSHALWMRARIEDDIAKRQGMGATALAIVGAGIALLVGAVLFGEFGRDNMPWRGEYYANETFKGTPEIEFAEKIAFNFGRAAPLPSMPTDEFSIRWRACLRVDEAAEFAFELTSDDGSRLRVDGKQVIDNWGTHGKQARTGSVHLDDGAHLLEVEYFDRRYAGHVKLEYAPDGGDDFEVIPAEVLRAPADAEDEEDGPCS